MFDSDTLAFATIFLTRTDARNEKIILSLSTARRPKWGLMDTGMKGSRYPFREISGSCHWAARDVVFGRPAFQM